MANRNKSRNTLVFRLDKETGFIKPKLRSLALRCDPTGSDDTDYGGVMGVSLFMVDKAKGSLDLRYWQKQFIWVLRESTQINCQG